MINAAVKREIAAMFGQYASREAQALIAPIREAIRAGASKQVAELARRINPAEDEED